MNHLIIKNPWNPKENFITLPPVASDIRPLVHVSN